MACEARLTRCARPAGQPAAVTEIDAYGVGPIYLFVLTCGPLKIRCSLPLKPAFLHAKTGL
jgi:hypothetical protein